MLSVFIIVGIIFILIERSGLQLAKKIESLTLKDSLIIGLAQACSVIPGVSRAGSVIVVMMLMGYKRDESAKYTFLLSLPTIFAASALDLYQGREMIGSLQDGYTLLVIGFLTSLLVAYFVVKWFVKYLSTHTLEIFGYYRLAIATLLIIFRVLL